MSDFIRSYPSAMDSTTCKEILERYLQDPRKRNESYTAGGFHKAKSSLDLNITSYEDWADLDLKVGRVVGRTFRLYCSERPEINYAIDGVRLRDNGYQIQHYRANGVDGFNWHVDVGGRMQPDGIRCGQRLLAGVLYLNTVETGGETEFSVQKLKIKPVEGTMLWFPVSFEYPHRGCIPVSGPKFIISTFMGFAE